ncbi:MAG: hypothetical protein PHY35_03680 [Candidatus Omnitrophica bacterium]|nr:hypothetical protein [Candidatus Omnitrophota bacterium]
MFLEKLCGFILFLVLLINLSGCESFARKFTRKPKKADAVEMVLAPEEYKGPDMTTGELYRQYFIYWKSWHDELINALNNKASLKKKLDCAQETLKNLVNMKMLLVPEAQKNFDSVISQLTGLITNLKSDTYGSRDAWNSQSAERIKANIQEGFIYPKVKNYLK